MKNLYLTLIFALTTVLTIAQTTEHLSFKGVPIDGTLNQFVSKMKNSGFTNLGTEGGIAVLKGDFAGYKDCSVGVVTLSQQDLVYKIGVAFQDKDTWSSLSGNYFDLKEMLTQKYGKPTDVVEKFDGLISEPKDDDSKFRNVKYDKCKYYSIWTTKNGDIELSIANKNLNCYIKLAYFDKENSAKIKAKAIDDL
ncbi:hypothetical protein LJ707_13250 [Mucilaginibacter sp. UR6-1]|uniref:hypothetical protein n=1 Tax=Mucilaginibacter sp. UR6-1 TaxID=1435643 RepID=UPI001E2DDD57|nr:hypothetical protein [Mucilaginibacter sp. UR6-1]MCC8409898.1 hypothetical protein [Mucilaginibacter sp. UR6-1]